MQSQSRKVKNFLKARILPTRKKVKPLRLLACPSAPHAACAASHQPTGESSSETDLSEGATRCTTTQAVHLFSPATRSSYHLALAAHQKCDAVTALLPAVAPAQCPLLASSPKARVALCVADAPVSCIAVRCNVPFMMKSTGAARGRYS